MFSTPQSKAYFNQEVIKGKLITQELSLIYQLEEELRQANSKVLEMITLAGLPHPQSMLTGKLEIIIQSLNAMHTAICCSNDTFNIEVSLREDIKQIEHKFFKQILWEYEEKIKQLKQFILKIEEEVQELERQGLLPYIDSPEKNNISGLKGKVFQKCNRRIELLEKFITYQDCQEGKQVVEERAKELFKKLCFKSQAPAGTDEKEIQIQAKTSNEKQQNLQQTDPISNSCIIPGNFQSIYFQFTLGIAGFISPMQLQH